jgi:hypothetical protein
MTLRLDVTRALLFCSLALASCVSSAAELGTLGERFKAAARILETFVEADERKTHVWEGIEVVLPVYDEYTFKETRARAEKFHPPKGPATPPVSLDNLLSKMQAERIEYRERMERFLSEDSKRTVVMLQRRREQARNLQKYQEKLEVAEKAKSTLWEIYQEASAGLLGEHGGMVGKASAGLLGEVSEAAGTEAMKFEEIVPDLKAIVGEYKRIIKEYDDRIRERHLERIKAKAIYVALKATAELPDIPDRQPPEKQEQLPPGRAGSETTNLEQRLKNTANRESWSVFEYAKKSKEAIEADREAQANREKQAQRDRYNESQSPPPPEQTEERPAPTRPSRAAPAGEEPKEKPQSPSPAPREAAPREQPRQPPPRKDPPPRNDTPQESIPVPGPG